MVLASLIPPSQPSRDLDSQSATRNLNPKACCAKTPLPRHLLRPESPGARRCWGAGGPAPSPASLATPTVGGAAGRCPWSRSLLRRPLRLLGRERKKNFFQSDLLEF